jgi:hypothetical protein
MQFLKAYGYTNAVLNTIFAVLTPVMIFSGGLSTILGLVGLPFLAYVVYTNYKRAKSHLDHIKVAEEFIAEHKPAVRTSGVPLIRQNEYLYISDKPVETVTTTVVSGWGSAPTGTATYNPGALGAGVVTGVVLNQYEEANARAREEQRVPDNFLPPQVADDLVATDSLPEASLADDSLVSLEPIGSDELAAEEPLAAEDNFLDPVETLEASDDLPGVALEPIQSEDLPSAPEPTYSAPEPSYSAPEPSYSAPEPSYSSPSYDSGSSSYDSGSSSSFD